MADRRHSGGHALLPLGVAPLVRALLRRVQLPDVGWLVDQFPIVAVAKGYRREDFPHDLTAGLALGILTVPQAVAYAFLAGLPAEAGLYACLAPMVIYALLGSSPQLVVGPVAIAALMVAATVGAHAPAYSDQYLGITTVVSLQVGLFLWLLRGLKLTGIVNLLSHPVISGFVNAAAILIVVSQLGALTGIEFSIKGGALAELPKLLAAIGDIRPVALVIGIASLAIMWLLRRTLPGHPLGRAGPMLVTVVATLAVAAFGLEVSTVGFVPAGMPALSLPPLDIWLWWDLAPNAALIALVAYVESYSVGTTLAARQNRRLDAGRELVALGAANVAAAFSGAYPVAGSFTRSSVNVAAGARSPMSVLVCAVLIVLTLLWLTSAFDKLPHAALAAIVIASVWPLIEFRSLGRHWRFYPADVLTHFATLLGVLVFGVAAGLLVGVSVAVVLFLRNSSAPHIAVLGRLGDSPHFRNVERFATRTWDHLVAVRVDESLYFANAIEIENRLSELGGAQGVKHLLLVMSAVNFIDTTGLEMLRRLAIRLQSTGVTVHLSEVKGPVRDQLAQRPFRNWLSGEIFDTTDEAFKTLAG